MTPTTSPTRVLVLALAVVGLPGCYSVYSVRSTDLSRVAAEQVLSRNYVLQKPQEVFVGQPVVAVRDYYVTKRQGRHMRPSTDGWLTGELWSRVYFRADTDHPVVGAVSIGGIEYSLVRLLLQSQIPGEVHALVGPDGKPLQKLAFKRGSSEVRVVNGSIKPVGLVFLAGASEVLIDKTRPFTNFDLIYGGTDGKSFSLTYREYTPDDLVKPGFTQAVTYENSSSTIRFRGTQLQILRVTSESLSYAVLVDDGAPPTR